MNNERNFKPFLLGTYGTLMQGYRNNRLLEDSRFIGSTKTKSSLFSMYSVYDSYPAVVPNGNSQIELEVFMVTDPSIATRIDYLEGYPNLYKKLLVDTEDFGEVIIYIFNQSIEGLELIEGGSWKEFTNKQLQQ